MKFKIFLLLCLMVCAPAAFADSYEKPSLENMIDTLIRFGAVNINNDDVIDEYGMVTECEMYMDFFKDDFKWQQIRAALRKSIRQNVATFPTAYQYDRELQLDRYDFQEKLYKLTEKSAIRNVNAFVIYTSEGVVCNKGRVSMLPLSYRAVIDQPLYIPGLPLTEADAQALLKRLDAAGNTDHIVYTRFNMRIVYIAPLKPVAGVKGALSQGENAVGGVRLDARLDSVDFYEDDGMSKLIYSYKP